VLLELLQQELSSCVDDTDSYSILKELIFKLKVDNHMETPPSPIATNIVNRTISPSNSPTSSNTPSPKQTMSVNNLLN
jgi:hypothetical protein